MFVRSVGQCVEAGLVGGDLLHMDGSLIDANASKDTVLKSDPEMVVNLPLKMDMRVAQNEKRNMTTSNRSLPRSYDEDFNRRAVEMTLSGRGPTEVACDLGIPRSCLTRWKKAYFEAADSAAPEGSRKPSEQDAEIRRLRKENAYIREQNEILKNYRRNGGAASVGRKQMAELCGEHEVSCVCQTLGLSRSGHYAKAKAAPSSRSLEDERLKTTILRVHRDCFGVYATLAYACSFAGRASGSAAAAWPG